MQAGIILFHMDGCPHCDDFMPIWLDFEKTLKKSKYDITSIDKCERNEKCKQKLLDCFNVSSTEKLLEYFNIKSFPTVYLYVKNSSGNIIYKEEYNDSREVSNLMNSIIKIYNNYFSGGISSKKKTKKINKSKSKSKSKTKSKSKINIKLKSKSKSKSKRNSIKKSKKK